MGGLWLFVELYREGSAPVACAAGLFPYLKWDFCRREGWVNGSEHCTEDVHKCTDKQTLCQLALSQVYSSIRPVIQLLLAGGGAGTSPPKHVLSVS